LNKIPDPLRSEVQRVFEEREHTFELLRGELTREILRLRELVRLYQIEKFGSASEKLTASQLALLNLEPSVSEEEVQAEARLPETEKTVKGAPELENLEKETRKAHSRRTCPAASARLKPPRKPAIAESAAGRRASSATKKASDSAASRCVILWK
jgi:hypothetical protein